MKGVQWEVVGDFRDIPGRTSPTHSLHPWNSNSVEGGSFLKEKLFLWRKVFSSLRTDVNSSPGCVCLVGESKRLNSVSSMLTSVCRNGQKKCDYVRVSSHTVKMLPAAHKTGSLSWKQRDWVGGRAFTVYPLGVFGFCNL